MLPIVSCLFFLPCPLPFTCSPRTLWRLHEHQFILLWPCSSLPFSHKQSLHWYLCHSDLCLYFSRCFVFLLKISHFYAYHSSNFFCLVFLVFIFLVCYRFATSYGLCRNQCARIFCSCRCSVPSPSVYFLLVLPSCTQLLSPHHACTLCITIAPSHLPLVLAPSPCCSCSFAAPAATLSFCCTIAFLIPIHLPQEPRRCVHIFCHTRWSHCRSFRLRRCRGIPTPCRCCPSPAGFATHVSFLHSVALLWHSSQYS